MPGATGPLVTWLSRQHGACLQLSVCYVERSRLGNVAGICSQSINWIEAARRTRVVLSERARYTRSVRRDLHSRGHAAFGQSLVIGVAEKVGGRLEHEEGEARSVLQELRQPTHSKTRWQHSEAFLEPAIAGMIMSLQARVVT